MHFDISMCCISNVIHITILSTVERFKELAVYSLFWKNDSIPAFYQKNWSLFTLQERKKKQLEKSIFDDRKIYWNITKSIKEDYFQIKTHIHFKFFFDINYVIKYIFWLWSLCVIVSCVITFKQLFRTKHKCRHRSESKQNWS